MLTLSRFLKRGRPVVASPVDAASLERLREETNWRRYDWPAYGRITPRSVCAAEFGRKRANVAQLRIERAKRSRQ